jgi:hypothetical protein
MGYVGMKGRGREKEISGKHGSRLNNNDNHTQRDHVFHHYEDPPSRISPRIEKRRGRKKGRGGGEEEKETQKMEKIILVAVIK